MQYEANSPAGYLDQLDDDWRKDTLLQLREMILSAEEGLIEGIEYKMLSYGDGENTLFHLNAQKAYVSLYVGNISKVDETGKLTEGLSTGKGCIRFKKSDNPDDTRIDEFIQRAASIWNEGGETNC